MNDFEKQFSNLLDNHKIVGAFGAITNANDILNIGVYGYSDLENKIKLQFDDIFRVASISKVIVALGIMKLVEQNILSINEDVSTYLGFKLRNPYFPNDVITLKMLMTQTSSLQDCGNGVKGYYGSAAGNEDVRLEDLLINKDSLYYDNEVFMNVRPGECFQYCNFGCGILVCIIERVTKMYFEEFIDDILLKPLGIYSGFKVEKIKNLDKLVTHYRINDEGSFYPYRNALTFKKHQSKLFGLGHNFTGFAGGLYISGVDLIKILMMLMQNGTYNNKRLFQKETILEMNKIHWQGDSYDEAYKMKGLQQVILKRFGKTLIGHFGNAYGLRAFMLHDDKNGYIFISNGADFLGDGDHLCPLLDDILKFMINYN